MDDDLIITFSTTFRGLRVFDRFIQATEWKLRAEVFVESGVDALEVNAVFTKLNYFFEEIVNDSLVYAAANRWAAKSLRKSANNTILTPGEPTENQLAPLLQAKMNAIGGDAVSFGVVELDSDTAMGLSFVFLGEAGPHLPDMAQWMGDTPYFSPLPWWYRNDGSTMDAPPKKGWPADAVPDYVHDLTFLDDDYQPQPGEPAQVIRPEFKPTVIRGTLDTDQK
jgi:hypothetical protein